MVTVMKEEKEVSQDFIKKGTSNRDDEVLPTIWPFHVSVFCCCF